MDGFGSHTFSMMNAAGERVWVKYHLKTQQGIRNLSAAQAQRLAGTDPDYAQRDLFEAIARGDFPRWNVFIQVMTEAQAAALSFNPFDLTKVWPHAQFPRIPVGVLELNRNPDNYHAEVEQVAFSPANVVPGLGFSPDKMLQGRLFAYHDAQLYRVGTNHQQLWVNRPRCPVHHQQRDGSMAFANFDGQQNYATVEAVGTSPRGLGHGEPALPLSGDAARYDARAQEDNYWQAGLLFRLLPAAEKQDLFDNIAGGLSQVSAEIQQRQLAHFDKADAAYGKGVRAALKARGVNAD
jgi:catalase